MLTNWGIFRTGYQSGRRTRNHAKSLTVESALDAYVELSILFIRVKRIDISKGRRALVQAASREEWWMGD